jgi:hypothetical protein
MPTRNIILGAIAAMVAGCSGTGEAPGVVSDKDPTLDSIRTGCGTPSGCTTGNGTGVYFEEGGSAGIDSLHLMITHFTNTSNTNGPYVAFQGRYENTTTGIWYYLPSNAGRVFRAIYNGVAYKVVGVSESSTYPSFTLQDYANDAPFTVYGYYFPYLQLEIGISTPIDGQWRLSFLQSTSGNLFGTDNYSQNLSPNVNTADQNVVYKWDMWWQNLKTLAPAQPYCKRAPQVDSVGNKSTPDDYVAFQQGIDVDPVTGNVNSGMTNDTTLSCRYGAIATAYYWGYNYNSDWWHYASAIHMKRASYCGDASYYTVSGTQINILDEVPIEGVQTTVPDTSVEAFWTPSGAACYNGPRRSDLYDKFGIKPFDGNCPNGTQIPSCSGWSGAPWYENVGWAMWYANYYQQHALVDGTVPQ